MAEAVPRLEGERVVLRAIEDGDVPVLLAIAQEPGVAEWWPRVAEEDFRDPDVRSWTIGHDGAVAGLAQAWEEPEEDYRHAGIDLYLGRAHQGRGLGGDVVRTLARWLIDELGHHRLVIDPAAANERAIRCYERVGFRRIGVQRKSELAGDGT